MAAGFTSFGENRVQERLAKAAEVDPVVGADIAAAPERSPADAPGGGGSPVAWHLVGPLQSNKARRAIELFDVIETVDSQELAERLDRIAGEIRPAPIPVFIQVNVDADAAKSGFDAADLERALPAILDLPNLTVGGLMTVGRYVDDPELARPTFVALRALSVRLREVDARLGPALSMGMTDDYIVAVEEGASIVRIGRAIFGARETVR